MRAFDTWNSYLDNDGNLMHGKVRFCKLGTTDDIVIYDVDGQPLRNPVFTDILGRTEAQVFLDDAHVSAYYYKYIGTGDMEQWQGEDYDESRWALQYATDDIDPMSSVDLFSSTADGVGTVAQLRALVPDDVPEVSGFKLVWVYGYYTAGDTSPVLYRWDSASLDSDDGGSVIMANTVSGKGRWKLCSRELHFDVRHFGVFPTTDIYSTDYSYTSQIANCAAYIDKEGLDAWFPAINDNLSYYLFDGTNTFSVKGDVYISDAVRFQCKSGTSGTVVSCHELHKRTKNLFVSTVQTGTGTLRADWINISWVGGNVVGDARVGWIIDDDAYPRIIEHKEVKFVANGHTGLQLDDCQITSNKRIETQIVIQNSVLKTEFFADDYNWNHLTSVNNDIQLRNCKDADTYILLKNKQNDADYGDLGEQTVTGATLLTGAIAENAQFSGVTIQGDCELHNVTGTVTVSGSSLKLNAVDCWLDVLNDCTMVTLEMRRGELTGHDIQVVTNLYLDDVEQTAVISALGAVAEIRNSRIKGNVTANDIVLERDDIYATVEQRDNSGVIHPDVVGCRFLGTGKHLLNSRTANAVVQGRWVGNDAAGSVRPIDIDYTYLQGHDWNHSYVYEDNTGMFLPRYPSVSAMDGSCYVYDDNARGYATHPALLDGGVMIPTVAAPLYTGAYLPSSYSQSMPFFAIGDATARIRVTMDVMFGNTTELNSSQDPKTDHHYSFSACRSVLVSSPSTYAVTAFSGEIFGNIAIAPRNAETPSTPSGEAPAISIVTFERLR